MNQPYKKVLIIAYVFPPIAYVGTYRTLRFCRYLPENGWEPHVLTIREAEDLDNDYKLLGRLPSEVKIYRTRTIDFWRMWRKKSVSKQTATNKKSIKSNIQQQVDSNTKKKKSIKNIIKNFIWALVTIPDHMVFWVPFAVVKGVRLMFRGEYNVIYTSSPPHSEHLIGYILSKIFRKRWVADFRDPMLDSSGYSPSPGRRKIDSFLEKLVVKNAHKIIIISKDYLEKMIARYPKAKNKFVVLPNGYDPDLYIEAPKESFDKFTILYAGSFYANRKPDFFLQGIKKWVEQNPQVREDIQVLFYGLESVEAKRIVAHGKLEDIVKFPGLIAQDELIPKQKGAHLLLLIIGFDPASRGTVTSKVFEYMACQRPILAIIPDGDAADILQAYDKLYRIGQEDIFALVHSLKKAYNDYQAGKREGVVLQSSTTTYNNPFDARVQTEALVKLFC